MRPIKLTIRAFGPYRDEEIINFEELNSKNLFLITGQTGAGKTTIFDAISFAMYGEANGNTRSSDTLRSQFADDKNLTEVELDFELKGIKYNIKRIPRQQKPKSRGAGFTEQKADASLIIYGENDNKVIAGVKNVNDKIESLIGINAEQFRQIMMIPQGEFKKLLMADSQDREKVLQKLFDTKIYNSMQLALENKAKNLNAQIKDEIQMRNHEITKIQLDDDEELKSLINAENRNIVEIIYKTKEFIEIDKSKAASILLESQKLSNKIKEKIIYKEKCIQDNKKIADKAILKNKLELEETKSEEIKLEESKIKKAKNASLILPIENNYNNYKKELSSKKNQIKDIINDLDEKTLKKSEAKLKLEIEESKESEEIRNRIFEEITKLKSYKEKVVEIIRLESLMEIKKNKFESIEKNSNEIVKNMKEIKSDIESIKISCEQSKNAIIEHGDMKIRYSEEAQFGKKIDKLINLSETKLNLQKDYEIGIREKEKLAIKLDEITNYYKHQKLDFFVNQAALIAKELKDGVPCPVCGSVEHVKLADFNNNIVTQKDLELIEKEMRMKQEVFNENLSRMKVIEERLEDLKINIINILKEQSIYELETYNLNIDVMDDVDYYKERKLLNVSNLQKIEIEGKRLKTLIEKREVLVIEISNKELKIQDLEKKLDEETLKYKVSRDELVKCNEQLVNMYKEVPENLRNSKILQNELEEKESLKKELDDKRNMARKHLELMNLNVATLETQKKEFGNTIIELDEKYKDSKIELDAKIKEYAFVDYDEYKKSIMSEEIVKDLEVKIRNYSENLYALNQNYEELQLKTKNLYIVDTLIIENKIKDLEFENKKMIDLRNMFNNRLKNNNDIITAIESINSKISNYDTENQIIGNLARIAKGDNKARITFERYVLAAFLDDILTAANIRLNKMTSGRYVMSRTEELERLNKQSGLELEVYDNYTGKSRHVKTLSGGESFKASLSMALGLSDFVQSYSGGVQLDTMFIDEGFGTLDQESLDSAINCLIELQETGRLVGIISHVQELRERIDVRLEVTSTNTGSKTEFII